MQFRKWSGCVLMAGLMACGGKEGQRWQGEIEHDGVTVEYETYYTPPSLIETVKGSKGIAARVAINGKTMALSPGVKYPDEWNDEGHTRRFSQEFWGDVAAKFKEIDPGEDHTGEHHLLLNMLEALRDHPQTLPPDSGRPRIVQLLVLPSRVTGFA